MTATHKANQPRGSVLLVKVDVAAQRLEVVDHLGDALALAGGGRDAAARAVRANPNLAEAQFAVGYVNWLFDCEWKAAEAGFRRALSLDPGSATVHRALGHALSQAGRHDEAEPEMCRTRELAPLEAMSHALSSQVAFQGRAYACDGAGHTLPVRRGAGAGSG